MKRISFVLLFIIFSYGCKNSTEENLPEDENIKENTTKTLVEESPVEEWIAISDLTKMVFFGTEPFWSLRFNNNNIVFSTPLNEDLTIMKHKQKIKTISENEIQVNGIVGKDSYLLIIRKEDCNDGMSDNIYNYSINVSKDDNLLYQGCGREIDLKKERGNFEDQIFMLIEDIYNRQEKEWTYFYDNDIKNFELYKEDEYFKNFIDCILDMGYTIKHQEGGYYVGYK
ncbi:MAG: hypothetical protein JW866_05145 [Ignavibacteriales bacterium]|nr:hypothetical protein [Ignavibacteriales bacterium]